MRYVLAMTILATTCAAEDCPRSAAPSLPALSQYAPIDISRLSRFGENTLENEVHSALFALPFYGVFDHLAFSVDGETVVLRGQVLHPVLRGDAANVVATIRGVCRVVNLITFLPDSPADNHIRLAIDSAIYADPSMSRYASVGGGGAVHIVVQGGKVSLEGEVASNADTRRAVELASTVPGVMSLTNHMTTGH
jgi:hypothetical protein